LSPFTAFLGHDEERPMTLDSIRSTAHSALPPLEYVYFYLTAVCNLACRHCWINPGAPEQSRAGHALDPELLKSVIEQAGPLGLKGVKLTGGEPLIHPETIAILDYLGTQDVAVQIETNGTPCSPEIADAIGRLKSRCVAVSLDGVNAATHEWMRGKPGCFEQTLKGVRNLVDRGVHPQIIMSVVDSNKDQMAAMVTMAESLGAQSVKFNVVQPMGRGEGLHEGFETIPIQELVAIGRWVETELAPSAHLPIFFDHPLAFRPMSNMFGECGNGCSRCKILNIIGVLSNGSYAMCGIGETIPELGFGHVTENRLEDVWRNNPVMQDLRSGLPHRIEGICGECIMRFICFGACVAQNYYRSRSLWAPHWFCEEARQAGLFPESRVGSREKMPDGPPITPTP